MAAAEDDDYLDKASRVSPLFALNQGEVCTCPSRALVHESIYDRFMEKAVARVVAMIRALRSTPPPWSARRLAGEMDKILGYLDIGRDEGAKVLTAAPATGPRGWGLLRQADRAQRPHRMRVFQEEIFGPSSRSDLQDDEEG